MRIAAGVGSMRGAGPQGLARWPGCQDRPAPDGGAPRMNRRGRRMPEAALA